MMIKTGVVSRNTSFERQQSSPTLAAQLSARYNNIQNEALRSSGNELAMRQNSRYLKERIPLQNQGIQETSQKGSVFRTTNLILNNREREIEEYMHIMKEAHDSIPSLNSSRDIMDKRTFQRLLQDDAHYIDTRKIYLSSQNRESRVYQKSEINKDKKEKLRRVLKFEPSLFKSVSTNTSPLVSGSRKENYSPFQEESRRDIAVQRGSQERQMIPKYVKIAKSSGGILTLKVAEKYHPNSNAKGYLAQLYEENQRSIREKREHNFEKRMKEEAMKIIKPHLRENERAEKECFIQDQQKQKIRKIPKKQSDNSQDNLSTLQPTVFKLPSELNRLSRERVSLKLQQQQLKLLRRESKKLNEQRDQESRAPTTKPSAAQLDTERAEIKEEEQGEKRTPFQGYLEQSRSYKRMIKIASEPLRLFKNTKVVEGLSLSGCSSVCYESNSSHSSLPRELPVNRFPASKGFQ